MHAACINGDNLLKFYGYSVIWEALTAKKSWNLNDCNAIGNDYRKLRDGLGEFDKVEILLIFAGEQLIAD